MSTTAVAGLLPANIDLVSIDAISVYNSAHSGQSDGSANIGLGAEVGGVWYWHGQGDFMTANGIADGTDADAAAGLVNYSWDNSVMVGGGWRPMSPVPGRSWDGSWAALPSGSIEALGIWIGNPNGGTDYSTYPVHGYVDNFTVTGTGAPVPEPSSLALLAAGLVGLLVFAWRKRK